MEYRSAIRRLMATYYVRHLATGANNGTSWANAYTSFNSALALVSGGDTLYIANDHVETINRVLMPTTSGFATPLRVIGVNTNSVMPPTDVSPPVGTGARPRFNFQVGGDDHQRRIDGAGYFCGIDFVVGLTAGSRRVALSTQVRSPSALIFENCKWTLDDGFYVGRQGNLATEVHFTNCTIELRNGASKTCEMGDSTAKVIMRNCKFTRSSRSDYSSRVFFTIPSSNSAPRIELNGVDFSDAYFADYTWFAAVQQEGGNGRFSATNCVLRPEYWGWSGANATFGRLEPQYIESSFTTVDTYRGMTGQHYLPIVSTTTYPASWPRSLYRNNAPVGGRIAAHTANSSSMWETYGSWNGFWNDTVGSAITLTVPIYTYLAANRAHIWIECFYPGDPSSAQYSRVTSRGPGVYLGNGVNSSSGGYSAANTYPTDSSRPWVTSDTLLAGANGIKAAMSVTFTPQARGWVRYRINVSYANLSYTATAAHHLHPLIS